MKTLAINKHELDELKLWLDNPSNGAPIAMIDLMKKIIAVYFNLLQGVSRAKITLQELRRAMGIIPKSEKGSQINSENLTSEEESTNPERVAEIQKKRSELLEQKRLYENELKSLIKPAKNPQQLEFDLDRPNEMMFSYPISKKTDEEKGLRVNSMNEFGKEKGLIVNFDYPMRVSLGDSN